ncbi:alpha/beta hydrolase [Nonomuraea zeae]|uniref:Alpha/beta hydrolase n=1 Tax=Nonomuraea zeae TaxID=1642303 RepID=A0A5S4GLJ5_9ACTN|nr:alpha/beta hydrolase [Nonomuraea zeae]TMR33394.1 alpha/beta hydrolase [Nonomuraea zeae]
MASEKISPLPTRHEGDPGRVAVLLPGQAYTAARPLLHFARAVLVQHGWSVQEIWWDAPTGPTVEHREKWVIDQARQALDAEKADRLLLVGKSLGTFAAAEAADRGLPAIWLTPLITMGGVLESVRRSTAPTLLVGGTGDQSWDGAAVRTMDHRYVEIPDANHGLEIHGDPVGSVQILKDVTAAMSRFVAELG